MPKQFNLHDFIVNSNKIDVQYEESAKWSPEKQKYIQGGNIIPGMKPGDLLYDSQKEAFEYAEAMSREEHTPHRIHLDLHRILTRGIAFYEDRGASGIYRKTDSLWVGGQQVPPENKIRPLLEETLMPKVEFLRDEHRVKSWSKTKATEEAWWCHHFYECVHPMIDGNGRTGRLLLNYVRLSLGLEAKVVWYDHRMHYYKSIQKFRDSTFVKYYDDYDRRRLTLLATLGLI